MDETHAAAGDVELAAVAGEVFLGDEPFDGCRAGGGCAKTALGHRLAQRLVVDEFARAFHRGEQGGLGEARRRLGFLVNHLDGPDGGGFSNGDGNELVLAGCDADAAAINGEPTGLGEDAAFGLEGVNDRRMGDAGQAGGLLELGGWVEDGNETFDDHVIDLLLGVTEFRGLAGGYDGKVIGDFLAIEDPAGLVQMRAVVVAAGEHGLGITGNIELAVGNVLHGFADIAGVIFRQVARVGARISDHLVLFIKRLGDLQGSLGGKRSLALKGC